MDRLSPSDSLLKQAPAHRNPLLQSDSVSGQVTTQHSGTSGRVGDTDSAARIQRQAARAESHASTSESEAKLLRPSGKTERWRGEVVGKYTLHSKIAAGGMASVYLGSLAGAADFSRIVAIKRMHGQFASDATFVARFRDEAWLSARLFHPNIVQTFDVVERDGELLLIMEYVDGVSLKSLLTDTAAAGGRLPLNVVAGILVPVLHGLHAAHEATDDDGHPLGIVHRDFSPQNIIVGRDGHAKILDFGIAKARTHIHVTAVGEFTGKFGYLAPEQIRGQPLDRRTDLFAAGIVLWEALTGQRLFREPGMEEAAVVERVLAKVISAPSSHNSIVPDAIDAIVMRALMREPSHRFATARDMALALENATTMASPSAVSDYLQTLCAPRLARLSRTLGSVRRRSHLSPSIRQEPSDIDRQRTVVASPIVDSTRPLPAMVRRGSMVVAATVGILVALVGMAGWSRLQRVRSTSATTAFKVSLPATPSSAPLTSGPESASATESAAIRSTNSGSVPDSQDTTTSRPLKVISSNVQGAGSVSRGSRSISRRGPASANGAHANSPAANTPAAAQSCDPPTYLDSTGIRHFKNGCL